MVLPLSACIWTWKIKKCRIKADSGCSGFNTLVLILEFNLSLQPTERFFLIPIQMLSAGRRAWTQCSVDSPRMSPCGHREQAGEQTSTQILTLTDCKASKVRLVRNLWQICITQTRAGSRILFFQRHLYRVPSSPAALAVLNLLYYWQVMLY